MINFLTGKTTYCKHYPQMCSRCGRSRKARFIRNWTALIITLAIITLIVTPVVYTVYQVSRIWNNKPLETITSLGIPNEEIINP